MALLQLVEATVRFGGHVAVDQVSFTVDPGSITGLIGPNGAGKTTTFNLITGLQPVSSGRVRFDGTDITEMKAHRRAQMGIARTFQRLEVFGSLSARDNVLVAVEQRRRWGRRQAARAGAPGLLELVGLVAPGDDGAPGRISAAREADALVEFVGAADFADVRADELPTGSARLVELGRALAIRPRLLLLDEPASGQDDTETEAFAHVLQQLAQVGMAVLIVEHDVPLVMRICAQVHVLDFGSVLASGTPAEIQRDKRVLDAYLGTSPASGPLAHSTTEVAE